MHRCPVGRPLQRGRGGAGRHLRLVRSGVAHATLSTRDAALVGRDRGPAAVGTPDDVSKAWLPGQGRESPLSRVD